MQPEFLSHRFWLVGERNRLVACLGDVTQINMLKDNTECHLKGLLCEFWHQISMKIQTLGCFLNGRKTKQNILLLRLFVLCVTQQLTAYQTYLISVIYAI